MRDVVICCRADRSKVFRAHIFCAHPHTPCYTTQSSSPHTESDRAHTLGPARAAVAPHTHPTHARTQRCAHIQDSRTHCRICGLCNHAYEINSLRWIYGLGLCGGNALAASPTQRLALSPLPLRHSSHDERPPSWRLFQSRMHTIWRLQGPGDLLWEQLGSADSVRGLRVHQGASSSRCELPGPSQSIFLTRNLSSSLLLPTPRQLLRLLSPSQAPPPPPSPIPGRPTRTSRTSTEPWLFFQDHRSTGATRSPRNRRSRPRRLPPRRPPQRLTTSVGEVHPTSTNLVSRVGNSRRSLQ